MTELGKFFMSMEREKSAFYSFFTVFFVFIVEFAMAEDVDFKQIRVATFNVSMEATNYRNAPDDELNPNALKEQLVTGKNLQIKNIAEIIQRTRPDIVLLNEFDYIEDHRFGVTAFVKNYLNQPQKPDTKPIDYPYFFVAPVNTGVPSPFDFNRDGVANGKGGDAWGYGNYPGQYAMVVLSQFPIDRKNIKTFQYFRWKDMPGALRPKIPASDEYWYSDEQWHEFRLLSKSMWDIPILWNNQSMHVLALHPTPPVFDGPENRNGLRNHDEIRLLADYLSGASYIYDDTKTPAVFSGERFVVMGDLNASIHSKETYAGTMEMLLEHPLINAEVTPMSTGGKRNSPKDKFASEHTAIWKSRADYVLPSKKGFKVLSGGVFWPEPKQRLFRLVKDRSASSDHRLVYLDLLWQE